MLGKSTNIWRTRFWIVLDYFRHRKLYHHTFFQIWKETSFLTFLNITWIFKSHFRRFGHNKNDKLMSCYELWQKSRSLGINLIPFGVRYSLWGAPSEVRFRIKMISWSQLQKMRNLTWCLNILNHSLFSLIINQ